MVYCGYCGVYRAGNCGGCGPMTRKRKLEGTVFCELRECAESRSVEACADCREYPCSKFDKGSPTDDALYSEKFVEYIRKNCR